MSTQPPTRPSVPPMRSISSPTDRPQDAAREALTAAELAARLGVAVKTIYRHADELGAIRVGRCVRFDPDRALAAWSAGLPAREQSLRSEDAGSGIAKRTAAAGRRAPAESHCQLLPVGRRKAAR